MNTVKQLHPNPPQQNSQPKNQHLWQMWQEMNQLPLFLQHINRSKIQQFINDNGGRVQTIQQEIGKLQQEHFVVVEGQIQFAEPLLDKNGAPR